MLVVGVGSIPEVVFTGRVVSGGGESVGEGEGEIYTDEEGTHRRLIHATPRLILEEDGVFWYQYTVQVELEDAGRRVTYIVKGLERAGGEPAPCPTNTAPLITSFHVPSARSTMRIVFYSCNGFSLNTPLATYTGPVLFQSLVPLLASPATSPHLLLGGGDQIYSDAVRTSGPLAPWASLGSPAKRRKHPYPPELARRVNSWYRENYISWYTTRPFSDVNGRIPMMNMWDDHDIIDGWGSYTDRFMRCPVFRGIGGAAWRYYMVFQHHTPPSGEPPGEEDPSWVLSPSKGRYIPHQGRSIYARLGMSVALLALDARTERTRHVICPAETYDAVFDRLERELTLAGGGGGQQQQPIKHVLILLGVPIAYPRLAWLENILRSPIAGVAKFLNKRFGVGGRLFNHFDGAVDILDDLDDHWAASTHKSERAALINRWQALAQKYSVRVSVLSGDVHLAALGAFYTPSRTHTRTPLKHDFRCSLNIISSAITNCPPPLRVAGFLARRNKLHAIGDCCEETMCGVFTHDVDGSSRCASDRVVMPRRNYCAIGMVGDAGGGVETGVDVDVRAHAGVEEKREEEGGLWVEFRVERKTGDCSGETKGYGFVGEVSLSLLLLLWDVLLTYGVG